MNAVYDYTSVEKEKSKSCVNITQRNVTTNAFHLNVILYL